MIVLVNGIFITLLEHYKKKWRAEKEQKNWEDWERYEEMREDMDVVTNKTRILRPNKIPRKKHRH